MNTSQWTSYVALTIAQAAIGVNVVASKYLLETLPIFFLLSARFFVSSFILIMVLGLSKTTVLHPKHPEKHLTRKDWHLAIWQGLFVGAGFNFFFLGGLEFTSATSAGIIASSLPAITALFAFIFLKEQLTIRKVVSLVLAMCGIIIMGLSTEAGFHGYKAYLGDFLIFLAMFPEATYSIMSKFLHNRMTATGATMVNNVVGFLSILPFGLWVLPQVDFAALELFHWMLLVVAGVSSLMFFWLWAIGLKHVPANTAALFGGVMPISTLALAMIFLGERLALADIMGMTLIFASIALGTYHKRLKLYWQYKK